jgi:hypothetical protein
VRLSRLVIAVAFALASVPCAARAERGQWQFISTAGRTFELLPSSDPDEPALRLSFLGGKLEAMSGTSLVIAARRSRRLTFGITLPAFIALLNFSEDNAMPWQTFRGSLGLGVIFRPERPFGRPPPPGGALVIEAAYIHESDHAVDLDGYRLTFVEYPYLTFDNGNFSSYEWLKLRVRYQQRLAGDRVRLLGAVGYRYFTPSINPGDRRELEHSFSLEARGWVRLVRRLSFHFGAYAEVLANGFSSAANRIRADLERDPLLTFLVEAGLTVSEFRGRSFQVSFLYSNSNGRGLCFPVRRSELGVSLQIHL